MPSISELIQEKSARDEAWRAERQAERENLSEIRNSALEEITTNPEAYLKYLKLQADNIIYSPGNVALAMYQLKDASIIGPKEFWHRQGRYVRDDAINKGAKVFASQQQYRKGYLIGDYYDISQTTGRELKGPMLLTQDTPQTRTALAVLMNYSPVPIAEDNSLAIPALYDEQNMSIAVNPACGELEVFAALSDEIGYARIHNKGRNQYFDRETCMLDAESMGYMLCRRFGVDHPQPNVNALNQLALLYEGYEPHDRGEALDSLRNMARNIGDSIEKAIHPVKREHAFQRRNMR